jgi:hypothetical protein
MQNDPFAFNCQSADLAVSHHGITDDPKIPAYSWKRISCDGEKKEPDEMAAEHQLGGM